jgi:hypothetical protein
MDGSGCNSANRLPTARPSRHGPISPARRRRAAFAQLEYSPAFSGPAEPTANAGPSLFTALTEQLGLTLQREKAVLPVLVIDRVEKPSPD